MISGFIWVYLVMGAFFAALAYSMFARKGTLTENLLGFALAATCILGGITKIISVLTHRTRVEGKLMYLRREYGRRADTCAMVFRLPNQEDQRIAKVSTLVARKYEEGKNYPIYISGKDQEAYVKRGGPVFGGILMVLVGILFLAATPLLFR